MFRTAQGRHERVLCTEDVDALEWSEEAYGPQANLMECKFRQVEALTISCLRNHIIARRNAWAFGRWKVGGQQDFPKTVRGEYVVAPRWQGAWTSVLKHRRAAGTPVHGASAPRCTHRKIMVDPSRYRSSRWTSHLTRSSG